MLHKPSSAGKALDPAELKSSRLPGRAHCTNLAVFATTCGNRC